MKKGHIFSFIYVAIVSLFLISFLWIYFFGFYWSNSTPSSVGIIPVRVLAWFNLLDFHSHIGGRTAHLHTFAWLLNLLFGLMYAITSSYFVTSKMKLKKGIFSVYILVFLISFMLYSMITFNFLFELERFAYPFFVPQV